MNQMSSLFIQYGIEEAVVSRLSAADKKSAVTEMVREMTIGKEFTPDNVRSTVYAVLAREELGSTGIGMGFAAPHTRHPGVSKPYVGWFIADPPLDFHALDDEPVVLLCCYITPHNQPGDHLRLCEALSRFIVGFGYHLLPLLTIEILKDVLDYIKRRGEIDPESWPGRVALEGEWRRRREAEEAVEARFDSLVRDVAGPMLRALKIHVSGRSVHLLAKASRSWNRRELRRRIESLTELSDFRTEIKVR
jgi:PTS system nitrogen regulatory IIA component